MKSQARQFESLQIWESFKDRMPWYFAVSTNLMPAKYLIAKCIPSNLDHLSSASEGELWSESSLLTRVFLDVWGKVKAGEANLSPKVKEGRPSLMDLNVELAKRMLAHCNFCRWNCKIDRSKGTRHGTCQLESTSRVGSYFHHRGEELIFKGTGGSGTIFFTSCNMRCSFCQNGDISTDKDNGISITPSTLALMAWQLRMEGCHNVNWVGGEPTIHLHTIVEAISLLDSLNKPDRRQFNYIQSVKADSGGYFDSWQKNSENAFYQGRFNCPQLWNSNFFMTREAMNILRNMMDVWLPDFKFGPGKCALDISRTPWYWETVTGNLRLVHDWGEDMVIRHLIMPNHVECCTKPVLEWIAKNMPEVPVNIMDQYHPDNLCDPESSKYRERYNDISRACTAEEITKSYQYAKELGLNFESLSYEKALYGRR